jgi:hypothetical protein
MQRFSQNKNALMALCACVFISTLLSACASTAQQPAAEVVKSDTANPNAAQPLNLNKTHVDSWHLGKNAQGKRYLLVVLKTSALTQLQATQNGADAVRIQIGQHTFMNDQNVKGGFIVFNNLPTDLQKQDLADILN